jgi:hypothetical protein
MVASKGLQKCSSLGREIGVRISAERAGRRATEGRLEQAGIANLRGAPKHDLGQHKEPVKVEVNRHESARRLRRSWSSWTTWEAISATPSVEAV